MPLIPIVIGGLIVAFFGLGPMGCIATTVMSYAGFFLIQDEQIKNEREKAESLRDMQARERALTPNGRQSLSA